jgi:magnesium transporter
VLRIYSVQGGTLKPVAPPYDAAALQAAHWIDLSEPSREEEETVEKALGIQLQTPDTLDRFYIADQVRSNGDDQVTLQALLVTNPQQHAADLLPVTFVRTKGPLVTMSKSGPEGLAWLIAECEECVSMETKDIFPALLDMIIDHAINVLDHIGGDLDRINRVLFQHHASPQRRLRLDASPRRRNHQLELVLTELGYGREVLVKLRRSVLSFRRMMALLRERTTDEAILKKLEAFDRELRSIAEAEVDLSTTAGFMLDGAVGYIGILQTKTINIMTIVGILLTPPVLIASVYGMNFKHMPELEWQYGYPWALGLMVVSALAVYLYVRLRGWL